jgi:peptidoglycan hydrolase-like protein with peptidoglycan-binding domain
MNDPASGVAGVTGGSQQDNMLAAQTAGMDKPPAAAASPAADPKKIARFKELLAKAAPAAGGAAAPAAGGAAKAKPDPKVMALQQELIKKGAKIKADGIMGPQTIAAQKQFGAQASGSPAPAALPGKTPFPGAGQISDNPAA